MLRIATPEPAIERAILRVEGHLVGPWVEELARSCDRFLGSGTALALDLANLAFVDREGARLLHRLRGQQVALENCSAFVREQLRGWES
jgi:hypothetical protein